MPDAQQLPSLLRLVDDTSETVRRAVLSELAGFGDQLEFALRALEAPMNDEQIVELLRDVERHRHGASEAGSEATPAAEQQSPATSDGLQRPPAGAPRYQAGQLVRHRRYGYRGVIVYVDPRCKASEDWYATNRTQPERDQAWYHVLVHGSHQVTYAAQTSLLPDESMAAIHHPLVPLFFDGLVEGRYHRNRRRWPLNEV
jgi:heat shock protein HspQ